MSLVVRGVSGLRLFIADGLCLRLPSARAQYVVWMFEHYPQKHLFGQMLGMRPSYLATKALLERLPRPGAMDFDRGQFELILGSIQRVATKEPIAKALEETGLANWWELLK